VSAIWQIIILQKNIGRPANPHRFIESHDFNCNLKVSQAMISILKFLAAVANSHRLSVWTYCFTLLKVSWSYLTVFELMV